MSNIVHKILYEQDLSNAGELFSLDNDTLLLDFAKTIEIIKRIVDSRKYVSQLNEQSIVEIVLTRCISALRDSKMIVNYYEELLDLLEICLKYNLQKNDEFKSNSPHANIVSDIFSCILLDYLDLSLSERAIPICLRLLQQSSKELSREITSYLNLIACRDPTLLSEHVHHIVDTIFKGQYSLCRLLYQLCEANIECIYPLTKHLIKAIKIVDQNETVHLLKIMYLISLNHVQLIIVHLDDIIEYLIDEQQQEIVLDIMYSIANQQPIALDSYLRLFEKPNYYNSYKVCKIISTIGKSLKSKSEYCTNLLIKQLDNSDKSIQILKEIHSIASAHPNVLDLYFKSICNRCRNSSNNVKLMIEQLRKLQSSSMLNSNCSSSAHLFNTNQSSINNSIDSIENQNKQQTNNINGDVYRSNGKLLTNSQLNTKTDINTINTTNKTTNIQKESIDRIPASNPRSILSNSIDMRFDRNLTIKEDDELDDDLKLSNNERHMINSQIRTLDYRTRQTPNRLTFMSQSLRINEFNLSKMNSGQNLIVRSSLRIPELSSNRHFSDQNSQVKPIEKDVLQQFCEKNLDKIRYYIQTIQHQLPMPIECGLKERDLKQSKKAKNMTLNFECCLKGEFCLFDRNYFEIETNHPEIWTHIMFLSLQSKSNTPLSQKDQLLIDLRTCYNCFKCSDKFQFVQLTTSSFPNEKQFKLLLDELSQMRFFDLFEFISNTKRWYCYLCANPIRAQELLNEGTLIQGLLKEKRGKWKLFKRWKKRLYSLTAGNIVYVKKDMRQESLSVRYIKSIQTIKSKSNRNIPKAFEIFTDANSSFVLKAKNSQDAEQWVQYLQLSRAHEISRCNLNDSIVYKTYL